MYGPITARTWLGGVVVFGGLAAVGIVTEPPAGAAGWLSLAGIAAFLLVFGVVVTVVNNRAVRRTD